MTSLTRDVETANDALYSAARKGHITEVVEIIENKADDLGYAAIGASKGGYEDLLSLLIGEKLDEYRKRYPDIFGMLLEGADIDTVTARLARLDRFRDEIEAAKLDTLLPLAARLEVAVKGRYAKNYDEFLGAAARKGYANIVVRYIGKACDMSYIAQQAAKGGYPLLVEYLRNMGADNLTLIAEGAAEKGHIGIISKLMELGPVDTAKVKRILIEHNYSNLVDKIPNKEFRRSPVESGALEGLTTLPPEIFREHLAPMLTNREALTLSPCLKGVHESETDRLKKFTRIRLAKYAYKHPESKPARTILLKDVRRDPDGTYNALLDADSPLVIYLYPHKVQEILRVALERELKRIAVKIVVKNGLTDWVLRILKE
jgi:hypothetical protein